MPLNRTIFFGLNYSFWFIDMPGPKSVCTQKKKEEEDFTESPRLWLMNTWRSADLSLGTTAFKNYICWLKKTTTLLHYRCCYFKQTAEQSHAAVEIVLQKKKKKKERTNEHCGALKWEKQCCPCSIRYKDPWTSKRLNRKQKWEKMFLKLRRPLTAVTLPE